MDRDSVVGILTRYGLNCPGIESWWEEIFRSRPDRPGAHPASRTMATGSLSRGYSGRGVVLTTHPLLAPRLKIEYSYFPSVLSWPALRRTLCLTLPNSESF